MDIVKLSQARMKIQFDIFHEPFDSKDKVYIKCTKLGQIWLANT